MAADDAPEETKVSDRGMVTIPASLCRRLDIEPGNKLRWDTDDEGTLVAEVIKQHYGAFDDFERVSMCCDGAETHDIAGYEDESSLIRDN
jgi:antitoxin PrlF